MRGRLNRCGDLKACRHEGGLNGCGDLRACRYEGGLNRFGWWWGQNLSEHLHVVGMKMYKR